MKALTFKRVLFVIAVALSMVVTTVTTPPAFAGCAVSSTCPTGG